MLDKIVANLQKYFTRMPTHVRVRVADSWLKLKNSLERLPKMEHNLMKMTDLLKISVTPEQKLPVEYSFIAEENEERPKIEEELYEEVGACVAVSTSQMVLKPQDTQYVTVGVKHLLLSQCVLKLTCVAVRGYSCRTRAR